MNADNLSASAFASGEYAFATTTAAIKTPPTIGSAGNLIRKLDLFVDQEIREAQGRHSQKVACKPGCHYCCRGAIIASGLEIAAIYNHLVSTLTSNQLVSLKVALDEHAIASKEPTAAEAEDKMPCPLLTNGLCGVYEVRPFVCRMCSSFDAEMCRQAVEDPIHAPPIASLHEQFMIGECVVRGMCSGLKNGSYPDQMYLLADALRELLDKPELAEKFLVVPTEIIPYAGLKGTIDFAVGPGETSGRAVLDPVAGEGQALIDAGKVSEADLLLREDNIPQLLSKLRLPKVYESEDHLLEMRARYERVLDTIIDTEFDPRTVFNQLDAHQTFLLAYQGLSVKDTLKKHGDWLHSIAQRALPQLAAPIDTLRKGGKVRVGYLSRNLADSNGAKWSLGWLENHTQEFETYAFFVGEHRDSVSAQFQAAASHFFKLNGNVQKAAEFIRGLDLDVLIFTDLGMAGRNYQYASLRLARIQCTAWGHPVTSGLPTIDYYLSSDFMEPAGAESEYTEKLVRLPRSGLCYAKTLAPRRPSTTEDFGLGSRPFALMGQNLSKWLPRRDHFIVEIFERTKLPVVFVGQNEVLQARLQRLGVPFGSLPAVTAEEYTRITELAEVSIDPPDWSGGNTTIAALTLGTPVVTLPGRFMRGRHSYAFHKIAGTERLIAKDEADYLDLVGNRGRRREIMRSAKPEEMYEDIGVVRALDDFIIEALQKL